jgi:hypothetical protein
MCRYHAREFPFSDEMVRKRADRMKFCRLALVVHVETRHGTVELDAVDHAHARRLADTWVTEFGHLSARLFAVEGNGTLTALSRVLDFRDFSEEAA